MLDDDGADNEKKGGELPESLKHLLAQEAAVVMLDYQLYLSVQGRFE